MRVKHWVLFSLASLVFASAVGIAAKHQATEIGFPAISEASAHSASAAAIAQAMNATKPTTIKSGSFATGEHPTQGTARVIAQNGKLFLELDKGFKTSNLGPDLVVVLHRSSNVIGSTKSPAYPLKAGDYVFLAPLQKFSGAQRYAIPATINLAAYKSVVIWCRQFNATFGAARLANPSANP